MQYRAFSFPSWSRSFWVVSIAVALAAAFFVVMRSPAAHAQQPGQRPDFKITQTQFDGRNLHVEYINATGIGYPVRRYEVGFQWYDASGAPIGTRHWLPVPSVERGGISIFDTKYRTDLTYRRSDGRQYNRTLPEFIVQRPNAAEELRITVDDGDRIAEEDERNNIARLKISLPDLQITGAKFLSPNRLELSYRNANSSPISLPFRIGFTWAEEGGAYASATRWINVLEPAAGTTETVVLSRTDASYLTSQNRQAGDRLDWYFERRPGNATRMKITIDDAGTVREANEQNNLVTARPILPDLVVRDAKLADGQLTFTYGNDGEGPIRDIASRVLIQWVNASGKPIGEPRWIGFAQMDPKQTFAVNADRFDVQYAVPGTNRTTTQRLSAYLRERPADATELRMTIDDEQRILEANEQNNSATVSPPPPPQPDFTITDAILTADALEFTVRNIGSGATPPGQPTSLWFEWVDMSGARVGALAWIDARSAIASGQFLRFTGAYSRFTRERAGGGTEFLTLAEFLADVPGTATHLKVHADGPNTIRESDEINNTVLLAKPIPPMPDLAITDLVLTNDQATWKLRNVGDPIPPTRALTFVVEFQWLDQTGTPVGPSAGINSDIYFPTPTYVHNRSTGYSGSASSNYILRRPSGAVALRVTEDFTNVIREKDETNNVAEAALPPPPQPDLAFTNIFLVPPQRERLVIGFENRGKAAAPEFPWRMTWVDTAGKPLGEPYRGVGLALKPNWRFGASSDTSDPKGKPMPIGKWLAQPKPDGAVNLEITIDPENAVAESNETNNRHLFTEWVPPKPAEPEQFADLRIADFTMDPIAPRAGDRVWFIVRVENVGSAATGKQTATGITVDFAQREADRKLIGQFTAADIAPGKAIMHRWTKENYYGWVAVAGTHTIEVCADRAKVVQEGDETNNCAQKIVAVGALVDELVKDLPDLAFTNVFLVPPKYERLVIGFQNAGKAAAPEFPWELAWVNATGQRLGTPYAGVGLALKPNWRFGAGSDVNELDPNGKPLPRGKWLRQPKPEGAVKLEIVIDPDNRIAESDEANNRHMFDEWSPPEPATPDLVLRDATLADGKLKVTIVNIGKGPAERVMWQFTWLGEKDNALATSDLEAAVGTLKPGASYPVELPYANARPVGIFRFLQDMPDGAAALAIAVDPKNAIAESDEGNNTTRIALPRADLAFGVPAVRGDAFIIPIVNHGSTASVPTDMWLQWYGKGKWLPGSGAVDVPTINGGATVEVKVPLNRSFGPDGKLLTDIPPSAERLRLFVDGLRKVPERNEQNNLLMVDRAVFPKAAEPEKSGKPDLVPEGLKVGPTSPTEGAMLDFSAVVRNKGTGKAGASVAWFIVDFDRDDEPDVSPEPDDVKALAPNSVQPVVWEDAVEAQAGTHAVEFCVDVEEVVDESNEDNNCVSRTFTVGSGAAAPSQTRSVVSPFRSFLGAILSGLATPIVAGERPY